MSIEESFVKVAVLLEDVGKVSAALTKRVKTATKERLEHIKGISEWVGRKVRREALVSRESSTFKPVNTIGIVDSFLI